VRGHGPPCSPPHPVPMKSNSYTCKTDDDVLEQVDTYKDRGVLFDPSLLFDQDISNTVSNGYSMLGLMQ